MENKKSIGYFLNYSAIKSAPGLDGIKFIMIKFLPYEAKWYLLWIFHEIMSTGRTPGNWLRPKVNCVNTETEKGSWTFGLIQTDKPTTLHA
jgi:hypothetical protein